MRPSERHTPANLRVVKTNIPHAIGHALYQLYVCGNDVLHNAARGETCRCQPSGRRTQQPRSPDHVTLDAARSHAGPRELFHQRVSSHQRTRQCHCPTDATE